MLLLLLLLLLPVLLAFAVVGTLLLLRFVVGMGLWGGLEDVLLFWGYWSWWPPLTFPSRLE